MYNISWLIIQVMGMRLCGDYLRKRHKIRCRSTGLKCFTSEILYQQIEEGYWKAVYGTCTV